VGGRCAIVVPDNVLFEGGVGETVRRKLLRQCEVHTLLRLPTGIWYSPGGKANVLFFDKRPGCEEPWTRELWVYDLRTNQHFTRRGGFRGCRDSRTRRGVGAPRGPSSRTATYSEDNPEGRWRRCSYEEIMRREGAKLDLSRIRDESLEDSADLEDPNLIAEEIADDLQAALEQFASITADLRDREPAG
jgi:type I restriction enzyme M protein